MAKKSNKLVSFDEIKEPGTIFTSKVDKRPEQCFMLLSPSTCEVIDHDGKVHVFPKDWVVVSPAPPRLEKMIV